MVKNSDVLVVRESLNNTQAVYVTAITDGASTFTVNAAGNLAVNLGFFMSHPIFTPYYTVPVAMLSLWSLLFAWLMQPVGAEEGGVLGQAARARS